MHGSRTFCQRGPKCHLKLTTIGPSAKRLWNGVLLASQWPTVECWLGSFVIFRGSGSILLGNPIFCDFSGGPDPLSPLWIRPWHASERRYLSEMFRDHRTQSRSRLYLLVCLFAPDQAHRTIFWIQTVCKL